MKKVIDLKILKNDKCHFCQKSDLYDIEFLYDENSFKQFVYNGDKYDINSLYGRVSEKHRLEDYGTVLFKNGILDSVSFNIGCRVIVEKGLIIYESYNENILVWLDDNFIRRI